MKKKSYIPMTKVKNPEPKKKGTDWLIWAAWADRITFEEIKEKTGNSCYTSHNSSRRKL